MQENGATALMVLVVLITLCSCKCSACGDSCGATVSRSLYRLAPRLKTVKWPKRCRNFLNKNCDIIYDDKARLNPVFLWGVG